MERTERQGEAGAGAGAGAGAESEAEAEAETVSGDGRSFSGAGGALGRRRGRRPGGRLSAVIVSLAGSPREAQGVKGATP